MKKIYLALMCMASLVIMAACGGGNSKGEKEAKKIEKKANSAIEKAGIKATATAPWPDNEFTKPLPKPEIAIKSAGTVKGGKDKTSFSLTFADGTTKEQIKAYVEKVKSNGFTQNVSEWNKDTYYTFSAENSNGYSVSVIWNDSSSGGLTVSKK